MHTRTLTVTLAGPAMPGAFAIDTFLPSFPAIGQAVVGDRFDGAEAQAMMASIAPVPGGYLHTHFGWRSVFVFLAVPGAVLFVVSWRHVPESLPHEARAPIHPLGLARRYLDALGDGHPAAAGKRRLCGCSYRRSAAWRAAAGGAPLKTAAPGS